MKFILLLIVCSVSWSLQAQSIHIDNETPLMPIVSVSLSEVALENMSANPQNKEFENHLSFTRIIDGQLALVSVQGKYQLKDKELTFIPFSPLGENLLFEIKFTNGDQELVQQYSTPKILAGQDETSLSIVNEVFPVSKVVPKNILFFHINFSESMTSDTRGFDHVKIFNETGTEIPKIWRERSFWLDNQKTLVLMVHPGRVKRGIEMSIPFEVGKSYTLVVNSSIKDIYGRKLASSFEHKFSIIEDDYDSPVVLFDEFELPNPTSNDELILHFSEGMDHSSITEGVKVYDENENLVEGSFTWNVSDNIFYFTPASIWATGKYTVHFEKKVCDYASNRLNRKFEITKLEEIEKDNIPVVYNFKI